MKKDTLDRLRESLDEVESLCCIRQDDEMPECVTHVTRRGTENLLTQNAEGYFAFKSAGLAGMFTIVANNLRALLDAATPKPAPESMEGNHRPDCVLRGGNFPCTCPGLAPDHIADADKKVRADLLSLLTPPPDAAVRDAVEYAEVEVDSCNDRGFELATIDVKHLTVLLRAVQSPRLTGDAVRWIQRAHNACSDPGRPRQAAGEMLAAWLGKFGVGEVDRG